MSDYRSYPFLIIFYEIINRISGYTTLTRGFPPVCIVYIGYIYQLFICSLKPLVIIWLSLAVPPIWASRCLRLPRRCNLHLNRVGLLKEFLIELTIASSPSVTNTSSISLSLLLVLIIVCHKTLMLHSRCRFVTRMGPSRSRSPSKVNST